MCWASQARREISKPKKYKYIGKVKPGVAKEPGAHDALDQANAYLKDKGMSPLLSLLKREKKRKLKRNM